MQRFRWAYLTYFAYLGMAVLFWPLYLRGPLGFDELHVGALWVCMIAGFIGGSWVQARIADATQRRVRVQRIASAATVLAAAAWLLVSHPVAAFPLAILHGLVAGGATALLDASTVDALGGDRHLFGHVRLFGTLGFVTAAVSLSFLPDGQYGLIPAFMAGAALVHHLATWALPNTQATATERPAPGALRRILGRPALRLLLGAGFLHAVAFGVFESFQGIHFEHTLGFSGASLGLLFVCAYLPEVLLFLWSPNLIRRFDARHLLLLAMGASIVRWYAMAVARTLPLLVPLQTLHALTFGMWYAATVHLLGGLVPPELRTSGQALLSMCFAGGMACGSGLGGGLRHYEGHTTAFLAAGTLSLAAFVLVAARRRLLV